MNWRRNLTLLRLVLDRRITRTPRLVFRELRKRGKTHEGDVRHRLSGGVMQRLTALKHVRRWLDGEMLTRHDGRWVVNSFLPPFPGSAYDRMFHNLLSGRRWSPVSAFLAVTTDCPADCWHCSLKRRRPGRLSTEQWLEIIRQTHQIGASLIGITGGEPLTRADLPDLVRAVKDGGAEAILFTSGLGYSLDKAETLRDAGLWAVGVSLDRTDPDEVDAMRGVRGAYDAAIAALEASRDAGLYTCINAVADRPCIEGGVHERLYRLAAELRVHELRLIEPMPCGRLMDANGDTLLRPEHIETVRAFHRDTNRRGRLPKVCAFNQIESPELFGCSAGTRHLFIDASGEVCPCDFTPLSLGNAIEEPLPAIWDRMVDAMGDPRRNCFIQRNIDLIREHVGDGPVPAPPATSLRVISEAPQEPPPDFVRWVMGHSLQSPPPTAPDYREVRKTSDLVDSK